MDSNSLVNKPINQLNLYGYQKYFELFHKIVNDDNEMNEFRLKLYERINDHTKINIPKLIFDSFKSHLTTIFGPDIAVQKNVSISINRPEDKFILGMHRDAPPHSTFSLTILSLFFFN